MAGERTGAGSAGELARELVGIPSVNPSLEPGGAGEGAIAERVAGLLEGWGYAVEVWEAEPGRPNVVARAGRGGGPRLMLAGHLDTVGVEGMSVPASGEVRGGRLYGRGAADMKGGLGAMLATARAFARGPQPAGELLVALVADEEYGSAGMRALISRGVTADAAVVCEPTGLAVMPAHRGFVWAELRFRGRAAHGSRPEEGVDAIEHAGLFLARLRGLREDLEAGSSHELLGRGSIHAGLIEGGTAPSVYPSRCRLVVERRTVPGEDAATVEAELRRALDAVGRDEPSLDAELEVFHAGAATEVAADHPLVAALRWAVAETGIEPRVRGFTGWVDAALLNEAGIPAVCFGPGDLSRAHTADEWVELAEVERASAALQALVRLYLRMA